MGGVCCHKGDDGAAVIHPSESVPGRTVEPEYADPVGSLKPMSSDKSQGVTKSAQIVGQSRSDGGFLDVHQRRRLSASRNAAKEQADEEACCLAWILSTSAHSRVTEPELAALHDHIRSCVRLVGGQVLVNEAANGLIKGKPSHGGMSEADTTVRCGQLLCRWALANQLGLQVGVHFGSLSCLQLPDGPEGNEVKTTFFGSAIAHSVHLATMAEQRWSVHLSMEVKQRLNAFRLVRLVVSSSHASYYLDAATSVKNFFEHRDNATFGDDEDNQQDRMLLNLASDGGWNIFTPREMSIEEFREFLERHGVDVNKFGKGSAKTVQEFYQAVVKEQKSHLEIVSGELQRVVHLVRISLRIRDPENKLRELRIASQTTPGGNVRSRDQPLAVVLTSPQKDQWQDAVERCFEEKLGLTPKVQRACFLVDMETYSYKEDRSSSETIPGIITIYKAHNIVINVKDQAKKDLRGIGLPGGKPFVRGSGSAEKNWTWAIVGNTKEEELMSLLQKHGVDASDFAAQAFAELYDEVYERSLCTLEVQNNELVRTIRIIKVWLHANVLNVDHVLVVKAKWQKGNFDAANKDQPLSMRMTMDQDWEDALDEALLTRMGLASAFQKEYISVDTTSHKLTEETGYSRSYPGLKTLYLVNEVTAHMVNTEAPACRLIGLPQGTDFTFSRREAIKGPGSEDIVITHWCWKHVEGFEAHRLGKVRTSVNRAPSISDYEGEEESNEVLDESATVISEDEILRRRVQRPKPLKLPPDSVKAESAVGVLAALMKGRKTDWAKAKNAAARIRDPTYTTKEYFEDITGAFPELRLYCISSQDPEKDDKDLTSSGRTTDDEYQRTIGALFSVFWIMRLDIDGRESFCFGLDKTWKPRTMDSASWTDTRRDPDELPKRQTFYDKTDWKAIRRLVVDAGLLHNLEDGSTHDQNRTLAMLVMMAIHDVMKLVPLLPCVDKKIKDFCGYKAGELISDHDVALTYVMVYHPELLPSFSGLEKPLQESIRFAHSKMEYNMGWLVQAEAPPGALFRTFRSVVLAGQAKDTDVAFYFVHWFVDLAGAEPCPLEGGDKFVLRFPQRVLGQFLESFSVVQNISAKTETEVLQDYLTDCWWRHIPSLGPPPEGVGAIAKMRLVLMAQGDSADIVDQFTKLPTQDQAVLAREMALTGCKDQEFLMDDPNFPYAGKGPAILIYYAPALMQKGGRRNPKGAMTVLAEVFRQARELWPFDMEAQDQTVTVRIDNMKELDCNAILRPDFGYAWVICRTSTKDATVKLLGAATFKDIDWKNHQVLSFATAGPKFEKKRSALGVAAGGLVSKSGAATFATFMPRVKRFSLFSGGSAS